MLLKAYKGIGRFRAVGVRFSMLYMICAILLYIKFPPDAQVSIRVRKAVSLSPKRHCVDRGAREYDTFEIEYNCAGFVS